MRIVIVTLIAFSTLLLPETAEAKYLALSWTDLLGKSDLVLRGEIVALGDTSLDLRIEEVVSGRFKGKQITVRRFKNWT